MDIVLSDGHKATAAVPSGASTGKRSVLCCMIRLDLCLIYSKFIKSVFLVSRWFDIHLVQILIRSSYFCFLGFVLFLISA